MAAAAAAPEADAGYDPAAWSTDCCHFLYAARLNAVRLQSECFGCGVPSSACSATDGTAGEHRLAAAAQSCDKRYRSTKANDVEKAARRTVSKFLAPSPVVSVMNRFASCKAFAEGQVLFRPSELAATDTDKLNAVMGTRRAALQERAAEAVGKTPRPTGEVDRRKGGDQPQEGERSLAAGSRGSLVAKQIQCVQCLNLVTRLLVTQCLLLINVVTLILSQSHLLYLVTQLPQ